MQTHQSVTRDIHRPRIPAAHDGLSKAQGCLWYSLANWKDKRAPVILVRKEEMTDWKKASRASSPVPELSFLPAP